MASNNDVRASWPGFNVETAVTSAGVVALWPIDDPMRPWRMVRRLFNIYLGTILAVNLECLTKNGVQWFLKEEIVVLLGNALSYEVLYALEGVAD